MGLGNSENDVIVDDGGGGGGGLNGKSFGGSVSCSICLEVVADNGDRSWAKLQCGHQFHLDCIGSAFHVKGAMQCPNCRKIEKGQWLYANGCRSLPEFSMEDWAHDEDLYDLSYSEMIVFSASFSVAFLVLVCGPLGFIGVHLAALHGFLHPLRRSSSTFAIYAIRMVFLSVFQQGTALCLRHHLPAMHSIWTTGCDFPSILCLPPIWKRTPRHMWRRPQTIFLPVVGLVDPDKLKPGDLVVASKDSYLILDTLPSEYDSPVKAMEVDEKPTEDYNDIGGLEKQIQELVEAIVLPMTHQERFQKLGIRPPKGILLYGPPGTGKTLMARACAAQTNATFLKLAGPQLVQMFIGDGAKLVRDAFLLAKEKSRCIIFIDQIDAIGTKRFDSEVSGDREVQRTMLELLNHLDGFSSDDRIKVIAATNRVDILDPALMRSGRLDRKIEFPHPSEEAKARILQIHSRKMNVHPDVNFEELARSTYDFNWAQLKAVCVEAGMLALRRDATEINDTTATLNKARNCIMIPAAWPHLSIFINLNSSSNADYFSSGDLVGVSKDSYLILDTLPSEYDSRVKAMEVDEKPTEDFNDSGGLEKQVDFDSKA
ncbi:hypothetical protein DKX38_019307 [Salix brachista]|uniref:RING-type domain-containing protein n=1 Tax=Salix brachista TaxID=2182728 RepID=A0A5N5KG41_9ROSI|nr:hypothetical protein DKX38_019307 [Salix brachista]